MTARLRRARREPRRPRGVDSQGRRADRRGAALDDPRDRAVGGARPAAVPERGRRARDWAGSARALLDRLLEVERELGRVRDGSRWGPRDDRPRPARLRRGDDRRAGADRAAPGARTSGCSCSSRSRSSRPTWTCPVAARSRPCCRSYNPRREPPRRARRLRGRARAAPEEGVQRRLLALPLLRADPGRHVPLQQARPAVRAAAVVSVLPAEDGGRLGLGQEPADADDPAGRGLDDGRRDRRGAPRPTARSRRSPRRSSPSG